MDNRDEVRAFLSSRRAKVSPEQAGIPAYGSRRVAGLRRGEVAALAGVSVEYYTRLERGNLAGVSESVLDAVARALRLDDTETTHLHHLARAAARHPDDQHLMNLIGELSMRSEPFRNWWANQDVYVHGHGVKRFRHPAIGELELAFEGFELSGDESLTVLAYSADPGTPSGDGLKLLATWAATQDNVPA